MFKNKGVKIIKKQVVVEPKVANPSIRMVDVNMASLGVRLLKNMCLRTHSQLRKSLMLTRKKSRDHNNLLLRLYKRCK
jgi:hypothetical protein